jgi:hypothetical protein
MSEDDRGTDRAQDKPGTFKVTDRRHFTVEGERRKDFEQEDEAPPSAEPEPKAEPQGPRAEARFERRPLDEPEGVDFTMLVNAMAQPALLFLGEIPHPSTGQRTLDVEQARIQVDMLDLLRVKCRGNLTAQEEGLLERVLYELRMLYVARTSKPG